MNRTELIGAISADSGLTRQQSEAALDSLVYEITKGVRSGDPIRITGFGTFKMRARKARSGRNPQTGATVAIRASKGIGFTPGVQLKAQLNSSAEMPTPTPAPAARTAAAPKKAAKKRSARKAAPKKAAKKRAARKAGAKKAGARKAAKAPAKKRPARKAPAKKRTTRRRPAKRRSPSKRAPARRRPARKASARRLAIHA